MTTFKVTTVQTVSIKGSDSARVAAFIAGLITDANSAHTKSGWSLLDIGTVEETVTAEVVE